MKEAIGILGLIFLCCYLHAQKISAVADRNKILLGEQISLQLKAEDVNAKSTFIAKWFHAEDTSGHIQIVKQNPVDTIEINTLTTYIQNILLTSFDSGKWKLPRMEVIFQDRNTGKQIKLITDTIAIEVLPVDVSQLKDYHDIKDVLSVPVTKDYWMIIAIAASIVILGVLLYLFFKKKKKPVAVVAVKPSINSLQEALAALRELEDENLITSGKQKLFYTKLSDICRRYFDEHLHIHSSRATSDEQMVQLKTFFHDDDMRTKFYQLLRLTDAVKFAKYIPGNEENKSAVPLAVKTLQHIHSSVQTKTEHV